MTRILRLTAAEVHIAFLQWLAGRTFIIWMTANQLVTPLLGLAVWSAALPDHPGISKYYVVLLVVQMLTVSYENHTLANGIYDAAITHELLRPRPAVLATLGQNVALRAWHLIVGTPVIVAAALWLHVALSPVAVILALPALALAAAIRFLYTYTLALAAFWTQQAHSVVALGEVLVFLLGGSAAPIALFPTWARGLVGILPFGAMLGFPAQVGAGGIGGEALLGGYALQATWVLVLGPVAAVTWRRGVRRYTAVGG